jgi:uncharacterized membrane protein
MLFIVGASLIALIITLPTLSPDSQSIALLVIFASLLAIFADIYILYRDIAKKSITHRKFKLIPCHRGLVFFGKEIVLCFRCIGFYIGNLFWGILTSIDRYIWNDFLISFGLTFYLIVLFGVIATVPIHGAWLRSHPSKAKKQNILRSVIGFIFSVSLWLVGGLVIYLMRGPLIR